MDKEKIDLNAPAFGQGAQKLEDLTPKAEVEEVKVEEPKVEEEEPSVEESKVPYSRFKKFHDEAKEYERKYADLLAEFEATKRQPVSAGTSEDDPPKEWQDLFGTSEESKRAWKIQKQSNDALLKQAEERALEAVRSERGAEEARVSQNMEVLDSQFETLTDYVGRSLTDKEQSAVLDIVDEFTPKDEHGDYAGAILPFEKAWEIYELKTQSAKAPAQKARNEVAALTGTPSEGSTTVSEADKNFNPLDWGAYKRRIGQ